MAEEALGQEWGPLAGMEPQEALKLVSGMYNESSTEVQKLKAIVAGQATEDPPLPPKEDETPPGLDVDAISKMSPEEAQKYLDEHTRKVAGDMVDKRMGDYRKQTFATDRENAKRTARGRIGEDFDRWESTLDAWLSEKQNVSPNAQIDPNTWEQAYTYLLGQADRGLIKEPEGTRVGNKGNMLAERPSRGSRGIRPNESESIIDPDERHAHKMWETQLGRKIPVWEWVQFRDNIRSVGDYDEFLVEKERREKRATR